MTYECSHCGGAHRMMEPCPEAPGMIELLANWGKGERGVMEWLAFSGFLWGVFIVAALVIAAVHGAG